MQNSITMKLLKINNMKQKKIEIPIYYCNLTIILDKDLSYVEKKYKTMPLSNYGAVTMRVPNKFCEYVMAFEYTDVDIIAHEVTHLKNYIFEDRGLILDVKNDEAEAYLVMYLFEQVYKFLKSM